MSVLVVDVGTSGLRAAVVRPDGEVARAALPAVPAVVAVPRARRVRRRRHGRRGARGRARGARRRRARCWRVGITAQRASTIVWDRATGEPVGPGLGWQDLRTVFDCITAKAEHGLQLAPNQSATKVAWLLNTYDPGRDRDLCFGTVDTWVAWVLSNGTRARHRPLQRRGHRAAAAGRDRLVDRGVRRARRARWRCCRRSSTRRGVFGEATRAAGRAAARRAGRRPAGQPRRPELRAARPGQDHLRHRRHARHVHRTRRARHRQPHAPRALPDRRLEPRRRAHLGRRGDHAVGRHQRRVAGAATSASSPRPAESHDVAAQCDTTDGVVYVPALMGLGTPHWDYGARGTCWASPAAAAGRRSPVRCWKASPIAAPTWSRPPRPAPATIVPVLRVDGGMSENPTFVQALANATGKPVEVSRHTEATTVGAGYLAGLAVGVWSSFDDIADAWQPRTVGRADRHSSTAAQWAEAVQRSKRWIPDLSALDF